MKVQEILPARIIGALFFLIAAVAMIGVFAAPLAMAAEISTVQP